MGTSDSINGRFAWEVETSAGAGDCDPYFAVAADGRLTGGLVDPHDYTGYALVSWDWERMRLVGVPSGASCAVAVDALDRDFAAVLAYEAGDAPKPDGYDDRWGPVTDDPAGRYMVMDAARSSPPDPYFRERLGWLWTRFDALDSIAPDLRCVIEADGTVGKPEHAATFRFFRLDGGLAHSFALACTYDPLEPGPTGHYRRASGTDTLDDPNDVIAAEVNAANARRTPAAAGGERPPPRGMRQADGRYWFVWDGILTFCENPFPPDGTLDLLDYEPERWLAPGYDLTRIADGLDASQKGIGDGEVWMVCRHTVFVRSVPRDWCGESSADEAGEWQPVVKLVPAGGSFEVSAADPFAPSNRRTRRMEARGCDHPKRNCVPRTAAGDGPQATPARPPR